MNENDVWYDAGGFKLAYGGMTMTIRKLISLPVAAAVSLSIFFVPSAGTDALYTDLQDEESFGTSADVISDIAEGIVEKPVKPQPVFEEPDFSTPKDYPEAIFEEEQYILPDAEADESSEPLQGYAYAVLKENGELIFFRSNSLYTDESSGTFKDIKGNSYTGSVYADFENPESSFDTEIVPEDRRADVISVRVADGQTIQPVTMGMWFADFVNLKTADLKGLDTGRTRSMFWMFHNCPSLESVDLSTLDTGNVTGMAGMFLSCSALKELDVSSFDTENVSSMSEMFYACSSLETLNLSNFDTGKTETMDSMFRGCTNLKRIDLSSFDTSAVTSMRGMFAGCSSLENLDLSYFNTHEVGSMGEMFSGCNALQSVDVSSFDTANTIGMENMFFGCSSLVTLDLSHFDTENVQHMSLMFQGCNNLVSLDVSSFNTSNVTDMGWMFDSCASLEALDVSHFDTSNVTAMPVMFSNCMSLTSLDVSNFDTSKATDMTWMFTNCSSLKELDVSGFDTSNVTAMSAMFYLCKSLQHLDVTHFDTSKVTSLNALFYGCENLEELDVSHFETGEVKDFQLMFRDCFKLKEIDVSGFDTAKAESMASMFNSCTGLTELNLSNFDTSDVYQMGYMFHNCNILRTLDLSSFDTAEVSVMDNIFLSCNSLEFIQLGKKFTNWVDNGYLPSGTWTNHRISRTLSAEDLYKQYPQNAEIWYGTWEKEEKLPQSIQLNHTEASVRYGDWILLEAALKPDNAQKYVVTWESADENIASVNPAGYVTGTGIGTTTIIAKTVNNLAAECQITVLFRDVADSRQYFYEPVYWAFENEITVGAGGPGKFSPGASCTREQFVTFLWRQMGKPSYEKGCEFTDVPEDAWYYEPISWAAEKGITTGLNDGTGRFGVGQACTREQCVTFLHRAADTPEPTESIEFTDNEEGRYYYDAIRWAAGKGITVGLNDGTGRFGVSQKCTRGMLVTFLYRSAHIQN